MAKYYNLVFLSNELYSCRYNILVLPKGRVLGVVYILGKYISDFRRDI
jgi:hypothetical protein